MPNRLATWSASARECARPAGEGGGRRIVAAARQFEPGQFPAHRAVFERHDRVREPGIAQRLGADDAARAPGAVDDDEALWRLQPVGHAIDQLGARAVERAGDAHVAEFGQGPAVDDQHLLAGIEPPLQLGGGDMRRLAAMLDELAKRLARHVDPGEQLGPGSAPAARPARHDREIAIAHRGKSGGGAFGEILPIQCARAAIQDDDPRGFARHQLADHQLKPGERHRIGEKRVALLGEDALFADIDERDLGAVAQHDPHLLRRWAGDRHGVLLEERRRA